MSKGTALMSTKAMDFIKSILPEGSTILEFGSGPGSTVYLSDYYNMISIENQPEWQNKYPICTTYINVDHKLYNDTDFQKPDELKDIVRQTGWFDLDQLIPKLPGKSEYQLMLVDGPGGWLGRGGILTYIEHFNTEVPIVFDDVHREQESMILKKLSKKLNREYKILDDGVTGYIL